jgi:hypothetical protein
MPEQLTVMLQKSSFSSLNPLRGTSLQLRLKIASFDFMFVASSPGYYELLPVFQRFKLPSANARDITSSGKI